MQWPDSSDGGGDVIDGRVQCIDGLRSMRRSGAYDQPLVWVDCVDGIHALIDQWSAMDVSVQTTDRQSVRYASVLCAVMARRVREVTPGRAEVVDAF